MKKTLILLTVIILSFCICACNSSIKKEILGKWSYTQVTDHEEITLIMTFESKTFTICMANSSLNTAEELKGTYRIDEEKKEIYLINEYDEEEIAKYEYINDKLCIKLFDETVILEKEN